MRVLSPDIFLEDDFLRNYLKRLSALLLLLLALVLSCGFTNGYNPKCYNIDRILNTIEELSSKDFNGRMAGTEYGKKTEEYVESEFKKIGLIPGGTGGTYYQEFTGTSGNASGIYALEALNNGKVIKSYTFARDYINTTILSHSGETIGKGVLVDMTASNIPKASGDIALLSSMSAGELNSKPEFLITLHNAGYRGVIIEKNSPMSRVKGSMGYFDQGLSSSIPRVAVSHEVFNEILGFTKKGYKIHISSAFSVQNFKARNVIGILKAANPTDRCLIISAHMDHLGPDPDGAYFPGALDNASGTSCIIEIARALKNQMKKPFVNIVFIAFSGEEEGLYGSRYYVRNTLYPLDNTRVINLDMVGAKSDIPMSIAISNYGKGRSGTNDFIQEFMDVADNRRSKYEVLDESASDHDSFAAAGVPAITIIDPERSVYHVPEDTIENIGVNNLARDMDVIMEVIGREAFSESVLSSNSTDIAGIILKYLPYAAGIIGIFTVIIIIFKKKK